jgi:uncharacterized protein
MTRISALTVSLILALCTAGVGRATENPMSAAESPSVNPAAIFADPRAIPLAEAIVDGDVARIRSLVAGADLSVRGDKDVTLLQWALLDAGADPLQPGMDGDTVVHMAAMANDPAYLTELLARRVNPDVANAITGAGPLRSALMGERTEQFHALLAAGADPDMPDRMGNTPLHVAGQINEPARALELLEAGADPMARNAQGVTFQRYLFMTRAALLNAETRRQREAVEAWLKAHGIAVEETR